MWLLIPYCRGCQHSTECSLLLDSESGRFLCLHREGSGECENGTMTNEAEIKTQQYSHSGGGQMEDSRRTYETTAAHLGYISLPVLLWPACDKSPPHDFIHTVAAHRTRTTPTLWQRKYTASVGSPPKHHVMSRWFLHLRLHRFLCSFDKWGPVRCALISHYEVSFCTFQKWQNLLLLTAFLIANWQTDGKDNHSLNVSVVPHSVFGGFWMHH